MKRLFFAIALLVSMASVPVGAMNEPEEQEQAQKQQRVFLVFEGNPVEITWAGARLSRVIFERRATNKGVTTKEDARSENVYITLDDVLSQVKKNLKSTEAVVRGLVVFAGIADGTIDVAKLKASDIVGALEIANRLDATRLPDKPWEPERNLVDEIHNIGLERGLLFEKFSENKALAGKKKAEEKREQEKPTQPKSSIKQKKQQVVQQEQKKYVVRYGDKAFETTKRFFDESTTSQRELGFKRKAKSTEGLAKIVKTKQGMEWGITKLVDEAFANLTPEQRTDLVELALDAASAPGILLQEEPGTVMHVAKLADLLGNQKALQECSAAVLGRLLGAVPPVREFAGHAEPVNGVAVLPGGNRFLSWSDNTIKLWDVNQRHGNGLVREIAGHTDLVYGVVVLPGGDRFLSWSRDSTVKLWDVNPQQGNGLVRTFAGHIGDVFRVVVLPGGNQFLSWSEDSTIKLWDVDPQQGDGLVRDIAMLDDFVYGVAILPGGNQFLSCSRDGKISLRDVNPRQGNGLVREFAGHKGFVFGVEVLPGGQRFLSCSSDKTIKLWDVNPQQGNGLVHTFVGHTDLVGGVVLLPGGDRFLSYSFDSSIKLWDVNPRQGNGLVRTFGGHTSRVTGLVLLPGGDRFLSCSRDRTIKLWDVNPQQGDGLVREFVGQESDAQNLAVLSGGDRFLLWSADRTIKLYDVNPFANLTFLELDLMYRILTSEKPIDLSKEDLLKELPAGLRDRVMEKAMARWSETK